MQLIVAQTSVDDNSIAQISGPVFEQLGLFKGDVVKLKNNYHRQTVAIALLDEKEKEPIIKINSSVRKNLGVQVGARIEIQPFPSIQYITDINILPFEDAALSPQQSLLQDYLTPYFQDTYRPISQGDQFIIKGPHEKSIQVKIVSAHPHIGIVTSATVITTNGPPLPRLQLQK